MAEKNYYRIRKENELFRRKLTCNENDSLSEDAETDNYDKADVTEVHSKETLRPTEESLSSMTHDESMTDVQEPIAQVPFAQGSPSSASEAISVSSVELNSSTSMIHESSPFTQVAEEAEAELQNMPMHLCDWYNKYNVSLNCFKELLQILRPFHPQLPGDPRTLLQKTHPENTNQIVQRMGEGKFAYFGVEEGLKAMINPANAERSIFLDFNIDGVPIYKSSSISFWPILCSAKQGLQRSGTAAPFIVAIYCGEKKPDIDLYLNTFCEEMTMLMVNGTKISGTLFTVQIRVFIADAPARSFIKQIIGHTGYGACERCEIKGEMQKHGKGRSISFNSFDQPKRTDASFREKRDPRHHKGTSPLEQLDVNMVDQFVLDYMHCVNLGVMRRLLNFWTNTIPFKMSSAAKQNVNSQLTMIRKYIPREFNRLPRDLSHLDRFKATEFRTVLLYIGVICFQTSLPSSMYEHFLLLFTSMRILCDEDMSRDTDILDYAEKLCIKFVKQFSKIYKNTSVVFNIHCLLHIVDDVRRFGALDSISAFPYETMLGKMKRRIRSSNKPLEQICKRLSEGAFAVKVDEHVNRYRIIPGKMKDSCVMLRNRDIMLVAREENSVLIGRRFIYKESALKYPCDSSFLDVYLVGKKMEGIRVQNSEIFRKCMIVPCRSKFMILPLLQ